MFFPRLVLCTILCAQLHRAVGADFLVTSFGAKGDKAQYAGTFIQEAIDACVAAGGGRVVVPPGDYATGTIVLGDHVDLHLEAGATLWASIDAEHYNTDLKVYKQNRTGDPDEGLTKVLIYAVDAEHISINGKGMIHGQAQRVYGPLREVDGFIAEETEHARRSGVPMERWYKEEPHSTMVFLESCSDVLVRDVRLIESSEWTLHFKWCDRVTVHGVYIESSLERGVNADGIDIDGCRNVTVSDCIISTGDDAIVLKTTSTFGIAKPCENVTVTNCVLTSTSTALKLGTESHADFRYINFTNCVVRNTNRGLSIVIRDGATAEHVLFSDIQIECDRKPFFWWGDGDPIWLVVKKRYPDSRVGSIRDVTFSNIRAKGQGTSRIEGFEGSPIENIRMEHVSLVMEPEDMPDKRATDILQFTRCENVNLRNVVLDWAYPEVPAEQWRYAMYLDGVEGGEIVDVSCGVSGVSEEVELIRFRDVQNMLVEDVRTTDPVSALLHLTGPKTSGVFLKDIDIMKNSSQPVILDQVPTDAVHMIK
jgi:hypothetical protein